MINLFDMLSQAQNGEAMQAMARQFGLSQAQVEAATEALMPAFSTGLKRNASDPMGVANFMQALSTGQHAKYFEDMTQAFQPQGIAEGNGILGHLFGSKDVSRAIAAQAQQATGIGQEIFKRMLPAIASAMMGGLFKQSTGQMQAASASGGNIMTEMMEQMMRLQQGGPVPAGQASSNAMDNPFGQVLQQMFGGAQGGMPNPMTDNPWARVFAEMTGGGQAPKPEPEARNPYDELFGEMFEAGRQTQQSYQKGVEQIFDQYLRGMIKHR